MVSVTSTGGRRMRAVPPVSAPITSRALPVRVARVLSRVWRAGSVSVLLGGAVLVWLIGTLLSPANTTTHTALGPATVSPSSVVVRTVANVAGGPGGGGGDSAPHVAPKPSSSSSSGSGSSSASAPKPAAKPSSSPSSGSSANSSAAPKPAKSAPSASAAPSNSGAPKPAQPAANTSAAPQTAAAPKPAKPAPNAAAAPANTGAPKPAQPAANTGTTPSNTGAPKPVKPGTGAFTASQTACGTAGGPCAAAPKTIPAADSSAAPQISGAPKPVKPGAGSANAAVCGPGCDRSVLGVIAQNETAGPAGSSGDSATSCGPNGSGCSAPPPATPAAPGSGAPAGPSSAGAGGPGGPGHAGGTGTARLAGSGSTDPNTAQLVTGGPRQNVLDPNQSPNTARGPPATGQTTQGTDPNTGQGSLARLFAPGARPTPATAGDTGTRQDPLTRLLAPGAPAANKSTVGTSNSSGQPKLPGATLLGQDNDPQTGHAFYANLLGSQGAAADRLRSLPPGQINQLANQGPPRTAEGVLDLATGTHPAPAGTMPEWDRQQAIKSWFAGSRTPPADFQSLASNLPLDERAKLNQTFEDNKPGNLSQPGGVTYWGAQASSKLRDLDDWSNHNLGTGHFIPGSWPDRLTRSGSNFVEGIPAGTAKLLDDGLTEDEARNGNPNFKPLAGETPEHADQRLHPFTEDVKTIGQTYGHELKPIATHGDFSQLGTDFHDDPVGTAARYAPVGAGLGKGVGLARGAGLAKDAGAASDTGAVTSLGKTAAADPDAELAAGADVTDPVLAVRPDTTAPAGKPNLTDTAPTEPGQPVTSRAAGGPAKTSAPLAESSSASIGARPRAATTHEPRLDQGERANRVDSSQLDKAMQGRYMRPTRDLADELNVPKSALRSAAEQVPGLRYNRHPTEPDLDFITSSQGRLAALGEMRYQGRGDNAANPAEPNPTQAPRDQPGQTGQGPDPEWLRTSLNGLSAQERDALRTYSGPAYTEINEALRGQREMAPSTAGLIKNLDSALAKNPMRGPATLQRAVQPHEYGLTSPDQLPTAVGKVFTNDGYHSTSTDWWWPKRPIHVHLDVPDSLGEVGGSYIAGLSEYPEQHEVLLERGLSHTLTEVEYDKSSGIWKARGEIISRRKGN
jgi:ADP-ribosyltransferase exoenzyme